MDVEALAHLSEAVTILAGDFVAGHLPGINIRWLKYLNVGKI